MSDLLEGATVTPAEGVQILDAGEFAAVWNERTPEQREEWWAYIRESMTLWQRMAMRLVEPIDARELNLLRRAAGEPQMAPVAVQAFDPIQELHGTVGALLGRALRQLDYVAENVVDWGMFAREFELLGIPFPPVWNRLPEEVMSL